MTLIEVLAAILLMVIVLPAVMRGVSLATAAAETARRRTEAASLAQSILSELVSTGRWETGRLSGSFAPESPDYRWSAQVQTWTRTGADVRQLDVHVTWDARGSTQRVTLSTLVFPPPQTDDASSDTSSTGGRRGRGVR